MPLPPPDEFFWRERVPRDGSSPTEYHDVNEFGGGAERMIMVLHRQRFEAMSHILGHSTITGDDPPLLRREVPEYHPEASDMVAVRVDIQRGVRWKQKFKGFEDKPINRYKKAFLKVTYRSVNYTTASDDYLDNTFGGREIQRFTIYAERSQGEYLTIPQGLLKWASSAPNNGSVRPPAPFAGTPISYSTGKVIVYRELRFQWLGIPIRNVPRRAINATIGRVNKTQFVGPYERFPPGTLLLEPPEMVTRVQSTCSYVVDVTYVFKHNANGWNNLYLFNPGGTSGFFQVNTGLESGGATLWTEGSIPDGKCIYDEREYADLFKLEVQAP